MRPPIQKNTLQQNEANRLHHLQQKQHQYHLQQQQQHQQQQQRHKQYSQTKFVLGNVRTLTTTTTTTVITVTSTTTTTVPTLTAQTRTKIKKVSEEREQEQEQEQEQEYKKESGGEEEEEEEEHINRKSSLLNDKLEEKCERELIVEKHLQTVCSAVIPTTTTTTITLPSSIIKLNSTPSDRTQLLVKTFQQSSKIYNTSTDATNIANNKPEFLLKIPSNDNISQNSITQSDNESCNININIIDSINKTDTDEDFVLNDNKYNLNSISNSNIDIPKQTNGIQESSVFNQCTRFTTSSEDCYDFCGRPFSTNHSKYNFNNDDDDNAAEKYIINYSADQIAAKTSLLSNTDKTNCTINLSLSETDPLLANIEDTLHNTDRSIYVHKNSNSLVFTKKELLPIAGTSGFNPFKSLTKSNQTLNYRYTESNVNISNNNNNNNNNNLDKIETNKFTLIPLRRRHSIKSHSNIRSNSEEKNTSNSKITTKHLPSSCQQQKFYHRRSIQLNYSSNNNNKNKKNNNHNNKNKNSHNLITNTSCIGHNNNLCTGNNSVHSVQSDNCCETSILHKVSHNTNRIQSLQDGVKLSSSPSSSSLSSSSSSNNRKQLSYSWYAPVYSALEEELEHDSRDSSPIRNLANEKKKHINTNYKLAKCDLDNCDSCENDTEILLNTTTTTTTTTQRNKRNPISIQGQQNNNGSLHKLNLPLQHSINSSTNGRGHHLSSKVNVNSTENSTFNSIAAVREVGDCNVAEGPQASSLGPAGGPQLRRVRFGNFLKSLIGLKSSINSHQTNPNACQQSNKNTGNDNVDQVNTTTEVPSSPEITITRVRSVRNLVEEHPGAATPTTLRSSREKLANIGSSTSLNIMQQKLWNIMRRDGSSNSLYHEKSQSIVQYTNLRKCETVLALTRQANSMCSPTTNVTKNYNGHSYNNINVNDVCSSFSYSANRLTENRLHIPTTSSTYMGSGVFSANGTEQIRPFNRLRNSASSINVICSRCYSLQSMTATDSRYSLNGATRSNSSNLSIQNSSHVNNSQRNNESMASGQFNGSSYQQYQMKSYGHLLECDSHTTKANSSSNSSSNSSNNSNEASTITSPTTATILSITKLSTSSISATSASASASSIDLNKHFMAASGIISTSSAATAPAPAPATTTTTHVPILKEENEQDASMAETILHIATTNNNLITNDRMLQGDALSSIVTVSTSSSFNQNNNSNNNKYINRKSNNNNSITEEKFTAKKPSTISLSESETAVIDATQISMLHDDNPVKVIERHFVKFTCKLCLADVDNASDSTVLQQCGCQFCTECMRAYVEFEICEGAYEISCPDAQCWAQGVMQLSEIANLTTSNLMKKHHRYRLNREIELDKNRTWCPRAGCETICLIDPVSIQKYQHQQMKQLQQQNQHHQQIHQQHDSDSQPSTSSATNGTTFSSIASDIITSSQMVELNDGVHSIVPLCVPVQCPSCKDEFCSACKKTWHPNLTCEEYSRRLVADGLDDIGIPFDNDLIKCCPMCAVPIEKDEGCAQMMCKRCKHVFCWYCLASLDDDFLLRHYDKGPCKNKLGHSRASVVWHRAQVIGIFAGFGILLLVASPLLLLAAPCIICCKCRSCCSKIDEGDGDLDEVVALQKFKFLDPEQVLEQQHQQ